MPIPGARQSTLVVPEGGGDAHICYSSCFLLLQSTTTKQLSIHSLEDGLQMSHPHPPPQITFDVSNICQYFNMCQSA